MKKWIALLGFLLLLAAGVFFFFYRMEHRDEKTLTDFLASYQNYDRAIAALEAAPAAGGLEHSADQALADLKAKASVRISSLIKNDGDLMSTELEIAELSAQELTALKAYRSTAGSPDPLRKQFAHLTSQRQSAYARFRRLGGLPE